MGHQLSLSHFAGFTTLGLFLGVTLQGHFSYSSPRFNTDDGQDVGKMTLVHNESYNNPTYLGRGARTLIESVVVNMAGDHYLVGGEYLWVSKLRGQLQTNLASAELQKYFPVETDRSTLVIEIMKKIKDASPEPKNIYERLADRFSQNQKMIKGIEIAVSMMTEKVTERVFKEENIKTPGRHKLWSDKVLAPFKSCMSSAHNYSEVSVCEQKFKVSAKINMGLALVHENAREDLDASYSEKLRKQYSACVQGQDNSNAKIRSCVLGAMRTGARDFSRDRIRSEQAARIPNSKADLAAHVMPEFEMCTEGAKQRSEFKVCADRLTMATGREIARQSVLDHPLLQANVKTADTRSAVADAAATEFARCMEENLKGNSRDTNGILRTDNCESAAKQQVGYKLGESIFEAKIDDFLQKVGGPAGLGMSEDSLKTDREAFKVHHRACVDQAMTGQDKDKGLEGCFTNTGRSLAEYLAGAKLNAEINNNLNDSTRVSEQQRFDVYNRLMANLKSCLAGASSESAIVECTEGEDLGNRGLERKAVREIGMLVGRKELKEHLNTDQIPKEMQEAELTFDRCLKTSTPAKQCGRDHAIQLAKIMGSIKLRASLKQVLGEPGIASQAQRIAAIEKQYFDCLSTIQMDSQFKGKIKVCSDGLKAQGTKIAEGFAAGALIRPQDSSDVKKLKERLAGNLEALSAIVPMQGGRGEAGGTSELAGAVQKLNDFIDFDPARATKSLNGVLDQLNKPHASQDEKRRAVVREMMDKGTMDQMIKSMVYKEVSQSLRSAQGAERPPEGVLRRLVDKQNFERIFTPEILRALRSQMEAQIINPVVFQRVDPNSPSLLKANQDLQKRIARVLVDSPHFGSLLADSMIQRGLNQARADNPMSGLGEFFGAVNFNWNQIKRTRQGQRAYDYFINEILFPKTAKENLSRQELARRESTLKQLVEGAVRGQDVAISTNPQNGRRQSAQGRN